MAAAMSTITKNAIFNLSAKAFPRPSASLSLRRKVSRVCFTSASKYSEGRNAPEGREGSCRPNYSTSESDSDPEDVAYETIEKAKERTKDGVDKTKEKAQEMKEKAKEETNRAPQTAQQAKEKLKEQAHETKENTKSTAETATDKVKEMKEKTKETAGSAAEKAKEGTYKAAETAKDAAGTAAEKAKEAKEKSKDVVGSAEEKAKSGGATVTGKTAEVAQTLGEKAKQTVAGAWGATKETTQKIKETVVGKAEEDEVDDFIEDHVRTPKGEHGGKVMDEDVLELRRKAGEGDDHEKKH